MNPVDPQFVKSLMENIYGNDEDLVTHQSCEDAEKAVEKHATDMATFGIPKNVGNAWKAPKAPEPKSQKLEDNTKEEKSLTESVDPMDERVSNIEQGLVSILESLKSLVSNLNEEAPANANTSMNPGKKFIEKRQKPKKKPKTVKISKLGGESADVDLDDVVPYADTDKGREKKNEIDVKAAAQALDKTHPVNRDQSVSKKEMEELAGS